MEFRPVDAGEQAYPVEYKRGKPKLHRADEVQLCAQALCLEEMTGKRVPEGALFYGETKRRLAVVFDDELRRQTEETIAQLREIFTTLRTPKATYKANRCRACSLIELCHPKAMSRSASSWRGRTLENILDSDEARREEAP